MGFQGFLEGFLSFTQSNAKGKLVPVSLCKIAEVMSIVLFRFLLLSYEKISVG